MQTIALIGFLGGLITGISPCILPVLPVIFLSSMGSGTGASSRSMRATTRPYLVIAGLVCSFSLATLIGSALLSAMHLPQDAIRWAALVALTLIGLGLIFPPLQHLIERPFAFPPQRQIGCKHRWLRAGPDVGRVVRAVRGTRAGRDRVAGGTRRWRPSVIVLTATFALGNALPLLAFALAGRRVAERVRRSAVASARFRSSAESR